MKISKISNNQSFGRLKVNVSEDLLSFAPIKKELLQLKKVFKEKGFSRKKNVDVILDYDTFQRKFVGIIESKKQGIPNNPNYKKTISSDKKSIKEFRTWLNEWDYLYSPAGIKETKALEEQTLKTMAKTHEEAQKAIKRHNEAKKLKKGLLF